MAFHQVIGPLGLMDINGSSCGWCLKQPMRCGLIEKNIRMQQDEYDGKKNMVNVSRETRIHIVDGQDPAPVEVGSLSHFFTWFIHPSVGFLSSTVLTTMSFNRWWPRNSPRCYGVGGLEVRQFFVVSNFVKRTFQTKAWKCGSGTQLQQETLKAQTCFFSQFQLSNCQSVWLFDNLCADLLFCFGSLLLGSFLEMCPLAGMSRHWRDHPKKISCGNWRHEKF